MDRKDVYDLIDQERDRQDRRYGPLEHKQQSIAGFLLVIETKLNEAKHGWIENIPDRHSALAELVQVAATAVACLEQYGAEGN